MQRKCGSCLFVQKYSHVFAIIIENDSFYMYTITHLLRILDLWTYISRGTSFIMRSFIWCNVDTLYYIILYYIISNKMGRVRKTSYRGSHSFTILVEEEHFDSINIFSLKRE